MKLMIKYIPNQEQEEESFINAKFEAAHERRKRILKERRGDYHFKESNTSLRFKVVSHVRS